MYKYRVSHLRAILVLVLTAWSGLVYSDNTREYQLKAAYLLNFARFIYWPQDTFEQDPEYFYICVYGESPFGDNLDKLSSKKIQNKSIRLIYMHDFKHEKNCNIIYISESEKNQYLKVIAAYSRKAVLTVSDISGFCESGGMIEFIRVKNKIKFEINIKKSSEAGIKYRSQLLKVANKLRQ